jgi:hypothetical protein
LAFPADPLHHRPENLDSSEELGDVVRLALIFDLATIKVGGIQNTFFDQFRYDGGSFFRFQ